VELGKTERSRRQVPLSPWAENALDAIPPRIDTPLVFPAVRGGVLNLDNWRRREWAPAIEAAAVRKPARIYDLRSTFASHALAAGIGAFELAKVMGTSIEISSVITAHSSTVRAPGSLTDWERSRLSWRGPRSHLNGHEGCQTSTGGLRFGAGGDPDGTRSRNDQLHPYELLEWVRCRSGLRARLEGGIRAGWY
jgi:hypothetical protein